MLRAASQFGFVVLLALGCVLALHWYTTHDAAERQLREAQAQAENLKQIVQRMSEEKRVAEVVVTDEKVVDGVQQKSLLFAEVSRDGATLPPRTFVIQGEMGHIDAMVIKFDRHFISDNDPLRGHSIALFTKIYGDHQTPEQAAMIDAPGQIPEIYRGADPKVSAFEQQLWLDFWRLYDDEKFRAEKGVRASNGQGVWGRFEQGKLYTLTLEADGGLNLIASPQTAIYREAIKKRVED